MSSTMESISKQYRIYGHADHGSTSSIGFPIRVLSTNRSRKMHRFELGAWDRQTDRQTQCRIKMGAIDAAALGPFKKRPTATDEKTTKVFSTLVVISLIGTISGKH